MFAKPFVAQLGRGHVDGVYTLANDPRRLDRISSASGDGSKWTLEGVFIRVAVLLLSNGQLMVTSGTTD